MFPNLEPTEAPTAGSEAGAEASPTPSTSSAEPPPVGVMDPESVAKLAESWASWNEAGTAAETAGGSAVAAEATPSGETPEPVAAATSATAEADQPTIVQSMPVSRPMSWLRRDRDNGEGGNGGK